jgi:UDP-glucose 4-epimerase
MVRDLLDAGEHVVVLDNLSTGVPWVLSKSALFIQGDVGDQCLVRRIIRREGVQSIIHFAASVVVPESLGDPLRYYLNNTVKSLGLIEAAVQTGIRNFIFSSTAAVYGMMGDEPVVEDAPPRPTSPYGSSKLMTEIILADASRAHGLRYVTLRYFNVAGADPQGRAGQSTTHATHLVKTACQTALGKRSHMEVFGTDYPTPDGTCLRDYIHVSDLTDAHMIALQYLRAGGTSDVFNCGYGRGFSVLEVLEAVKRASGRSFEVRKGSRRPGDPAVVIAASGKIRRSLGWTPKHDSLDTIVQHTLAWERHLSQTGNLCQPVLHTDPTRNPPDPG